MSNELEVLAARRQLLATRCSLQRLRAAHQAQQLRAGLPFSGRTGNIARIVQYAGIVFTIVRFIRQWRGRR